MKKKKYSFDCIGTHYSPSDQLQKAVKVVDQMSDSLYLYVETWIHDAWHVDNLPSPPMIAACLLDHAEKMQSLYHDSRDEELKKSYKRIYDESMQVANDIFKCYQR